MKKEETNGWIGVDLDGTLAFYDIWKGIAHIGAPIPNMVKKVKEAITSGYRVKIFTARAGHSEAIPHIKEWCKEHLGKELEVTNVKDFSCIEIWDDRAKQVIRNKGEFVA